MNIKTWQERWDTLGIPKDMAIQAEIDELRAALKERDAEIQRQYACIASHARITQAAEVKVEEQRKVLEQALEALENHAGNYKLNDVQCDHQNAAITAIQEQLKMKQQTDVNRVCTITVYGVKIDVVDFYKTHGFKTLPPQLTMSGNDLRMLGEVPANYSLDGPSQRNIASAQAVPVNDGDEFYAIPPATM